MTTHSKKHEPVSLKRDRTRSGTPYFYRDTPSGRRRQTQSRLRRFFSWRGMIKNFFILLVFLMLVGCAFLAYYIVMLPDISGLAKSKEEAGVEILAMDGTAVARYGQISGSFVEFEQLPPHLIHAVIATEDRRFFSHFGVDVKGVLRAVVVNVQSGRMTQGGSTITQQLAKNLFFSPERTLNRKMQELVMALWLEQNFSKKEILAIYLNRVYMGGGSYGIEAAARFYFDKPAVQLDLVESAMIAGMLKAPSRYNPTSDKARAIKRTTQVLFNMHDAGYLGETEMRAAIASLTDGSRTFKQTLFSNQRYFTDWIMEQVPEYVGEINEDMVIKTTIQPQWQGAAERSMAAVMTAEVRKAQRVSQAAFIAMSPDGAVRAIIGGIDYNKSQYNRATQAKRQPGSAFKLFVYLAAMEHGYTPDTVMMDTPITIGRWTARNYEDKYRGNMTLRSALAQSSNVIAVRLTQMVGVSNVRNAAKRLGVLSYIPAYPSIALGSVEMSLEELVRAFAHMAHNGKAVKPYGILEVRRKRDGKMLYQRTQRDDYSDVTVVAEEQVKKMNTMLSEVINSGTGRSAQIGRPVAGKTGTTSDYKDAWFIGYTPQLVAGAWAGNDDATPMRKVTGGGIPARIWKGFMMEALKGMAVAPLPRYEPVWQPPATLPWLNQSSSSAPAPVPVTPQAPAQDYQLQDSFWDKLFDESDVEYRYPSE
ncbi:MAG: PBP1A family penicillin-binding protein [Alphaproteobacteria bacterium]|nr:MAG: PBP1A family penicillin-binding protein [Alphaproteobacteria bacterium]